MLEDRRLLAADVSFATMLSDGPEGESQTHASVPGQLVVAFESNVTPAMRSLLANKFGVKISQYYPQTNMALLELQPGMNVDVAAQQWTTLPEVKLAEPNFLFEKDRVPNDPFLNDQWGLNNIGQIPFFGTTDADIDAFEGWDISVGSSSVVVAVIDTGIDLNHPDLRDNIYVNTGEIANNGIDDDGNGYIDDVSGWDTANNDNDPTDTDGHGTHVSGIVAAVGDNNFGVTGVSWNTKILPIKAGDPTFSLAALVGATDVMLTYKSRGVNIVASNNSYGGTAFSGIQFLAAQQATNAGILMVTSAGNSSSNTDFVQHYPSNFDLPEVISVAASDPDDQLAVFSSFGKQTVDLAAPGVQILSTIPGGWTYQDGTSMASPMVTGVAAILKALEPSLTALQVKNLILSSVDPVANLAPVVLTGGRLNLRKAIDALPKGAFRGIVYEDINRNGRRDVNEFGIPNARVFVDLDGNGLENAGEPFAITAGDGTYNIVNFQGAGTYSVVVQPIPGFNPISPPGGGKQVVVPGRQDIIPGIDFGFQRPGGGGPTGVIFHDVNGNRRQDQGEPGIAGATIYFDVDDDGRADFGEPSVRSGPDGKFSLPEQPTGTYKVRAQVGPGWRQTLPGGTSQFQTIIFGTGNGSSQVVDFGYTDGNLLDFGNARPGSNLADDGARYGVLAGFQLGPTISGEADAVATDVNDGVVFVSPFFAGGAATATVDVRLGGQSRGFLQAWIDFNKDGDFNDPGEKVITDLRLGEGVHTISLPIPANALTGPTQARFRYGWERGMGPNGFGSAGEVEDYTVNIFGDSPQAIDDVASVNQDSAGNVLNVLSNDFPSSAGGLKIQSANSPTLRGGTVVVAADKLSLTYTPRPNFFGTDSFNYTITDNSGKVATARVTVNVIPTFTAPQAVDDQQAVASNSANNAIRVLLNDVLGANPPTRISAIVRNPANGTVTIDSNGTPNPDDDVIRYTPNPNFVGVDQFRYRITDNVGASSEAVVTVFVGDTFSDDLIRYNVRFTDPVTGNPINQVEVGKSFVATVTVNDIRLGVPQSDMGAFAAYLDLLYPATFVAISSPLVFNGDYTDTPEGDTSVPGIINESGAFRTFDQLPPGPGEKVVYRATFRATTTGTATFFTDPADDVFDAGPPPVFGNHDTLLYEPTTNVAIKDISYLAGSINIIAAAGSPEGERPMHNYAWANDVNGDRRLNSSDVVAMLSYLGRAGASGEAESGTSAGGHRHRLFYDTTLDFKVTTQDLFNILREMTSTTVRPGGEGEGESSAGAGSAEVLPISAPALVADIVGPSTQRTIETVGTTPTTVASGPRAAFLAPVRAANERHDLALQSWLRDSREGGTEDLDDNFFEDVLSGWQE